MKVAREPGTAVCYWALCVLFFLVVGVSAECTWEGLGTMIASSGQDIQDLQDIDNLEDCQQWCEDNRDRCVGVQHQPGSSPKCLRYEEEPTLFDGGGINAYTYYNMSCTGEPTNATEPPTSTATSATSATSASACTMQEVSGKTVTSSTPFSDTVTADSDFCKTVCKWTSECTAITYEESTSTCTIHTSEVTDSSADGKTFSRKTDCEDGKACCFEGDLSNTQGTSSSSYLSDLSDELRSCKTVCEIASACTALTFSGSTCSLYNTASFESKDQSGSSYYSKSCTGGSLTFASICDSHGIQLQFSKLLGVLLVAVYTALF